MTIYGASVYPLCMRSGYVNSEIGTHVSQYDCMLEYLAVCICVYVRENYRAFAWAETGDLKKIVTVFRFSKSA